MNAEGRIVTAARWISGATIVAAARGFYQAVSDEPGLAAPSGAREGSVPWELSRSVASCSSATC